MGHSMIIVLISSLLMALIFVPVIGGLVGKQPSKSSSRKVSAPRFYRWILKFSIKRPVITMLIIFGIIGFAFYSYIKEGLGVSFFPDIEPERANIQVLARGDLSATEKDKIVNATEIKLGQPDGVDIIYGRSKNAEPNGPRDSIGVIRTVFSDWQLRDPAKTIMDKMRETISQIPGANINIQAQQEGPGGGQPVKIELLGSNLDEIVKNIVGVREPSDGVPGGVLGAAAGMKDKQQLAQRRGTEVIKQNKTSFVKSFLWAFENAEKEEKENIIKQWETKMGNVSINLTNMATGVETKGAEYLSNKIGLENSLPTRIDENSVVEVIASLDLPQDFQAKMSAAQNLAGDDILDLTIKNNVFGISFNEEEGSGSTIEASGMLKFDEQGLKFKPAITKDDKNFITKSLDVVKTVGDEGVIGLNIAQGEENNLNKVGISFGSPINTKNLDFGNISLQTTTETSDNKDKTDSGITYTFPDGSTTIGATFERDNTKGEDVKKYEFEKYLDNSKLFANRKEGDKGTNLNYGVEFNDGILEGLTIDKQNFLKYGKKFDLNTYDPEDQFNIKKNRGIIEIGGSLNNELEPNFNIMFTKKFDGNYNKRDKPYNYSYSGNELDEIYEEYQKTDGFTKEPVDEKMLPPRMFADGGIAGLTKTIAPESGPKPQGLPYVYNNVKKI